jgi:hypothetical protein
VSILENIGLCWFLIGFPVIVSELGIRPGKSSGSEIMVAIGLWMGGALYFSNKAEKIRQKKRWAAK